ncbi:MAG TPA: DUF4142 domain-containing protein [Kofleriaceae bacterium]|nr:DUF4142 domain-containing protein [Kofleriaceae bacterium]
MSLTATLRGATLAVALLAAASVHAQPPPEPAPAPAPAPKGKPQPGQKQIVLSASDVQALTTLHAIDLHEIDAGGLAGRRAGSKGVKQYAAMLVRDHQQIDKDTIELAMAGNLNLPDRPTPRDDAERAEMQKEMAAMQRLQTLEGEAFDKEFLTAMIEGHQRAIAKVEEAMGMVKETQVKALLIRVKPVLQLHLDKAKMLAAGKQQAAH